MWPHPGRLSRLGDDEVGLLIRVKATYMDADGVIETVFSAPTDAVVNVNDPPTGAPVISDTTPTEGLALSVSTASIIDLDGIDPAVVFTFQWQELIGAIWTDYRRRDGNDSSSPGHGAGRQAASRGRDLHRRPGHDRDRALGCDRHRRRRDHLRRRHRDHQRNGRR